MKKWLLLVLLCATPASAQISVPNTFTANTIIKSTEVNANFSALAVNALNRTGGIMSGTLTTLSVLPFAGATYDLGSSGTKFRSAFFSAVVNAADLTLASPVTGITVAGNVIVNSTGKIPALTSTYFTALSFDSANLTGTIAAISGANLTNLNATNLASGTIPNGRFPATLPAADGSALTNLNATNLASGTVPNGRFPANLPAVNGSALTSLTASNLVGTIADGRLSGNVPLLSAANVWTGVTNGFQGDVNIGVNSGGGALLVISRSIGSGGDTIATSTYAGAATGLASAGPAIGVGRNSSGTGSPGMIHFVRKDGTDAWIWADTSGKIRTSATGVAPPQVDTGDTVGTVVGDQTSTLDTKRLLGDDLQPFDALDIVLHTPVRQFVYKNGAYSGSTFQGIIADWSPEFAMDPDAQHPNGRSFNPVNAFGYTVESIKALQAEIDALRADIAELKARQ